jgi:hypothetical protein
MYDPTVGQFISEDPIEFDAGDPNLRRYVENSPTNATDPSGLFPIDPLFYPDPDGGGMVPPSVITEAERLQIVLRALSEVWIVFGGIDRCNRLVEAMRDRIVALGPEYFDNDLYVIEYVDFMIPPTGGWVEHGGLKVTFKETGEVFYIDNGSIQGTGIHNNPLIFSTIDLVPPTSLPPGWSEWLTCPLEPARGKPSYWGWHYIRPLIPWLN